MRITAEAGWKVTRLKNVTAEIKYVEDDFNSRLSRLFGFAN